MIYEQPTKKQVLKRFKKPDANFNAKKFMVISALLVGAGAVLCGVGWLTQTHSTSPSVINSGLQASYYGTGAVGFGFGVATLILAIPWFAMSVIWFAGEKLLDSKTVRKFFGDKYGDKNDSN